LECGWQSISIKAKKKPKGNCSELQYFGAFRLSTSYGKTKSLSLLKGAMYNNKCNNYNLQSKTLISKKIKLFFG
jgi:hypothetical protein